MAKNFIDLVGIEIQPNHDDKYQSIGFVTLDEKHGQFYDFVHGGVLYSLADTLAGYSSWKNVNAENERVVTLEMKMNYVASCPVRGKIKAVSTIKHLGRRTIVVAVDVFSLVQDLDEKLVATAIATFQRLQNKNEG